MAMSMNIRTTIWLLLCLGGSVSANGDEYRRQSLVGLHGGQASDTAGVGWWQVAVGQRWKQRTHEFRLNGGYLSLDDNRSGIADTWLRATRLFQRPWLRQWWDVQWRLKLPTADASQGLGTGSVDNELRVQSLVQWRPVLGWYYGGYRVRGHSTEYRLQNGFSWGSGVFWQRWSLAYDGRESAFSHRPDLHNISVMRQFRAGKALVSPYVRWRTNDEWGAGLSLRW